MKTIVLSGEGASSYGVKGLQFVKGVPQVVEDDKIANTLLQDTMPSGKKYFSEVKQEDAEEVVEAPKAAEKPAAAPAAGKGKVSLSKASKAPKDDDGDGTPL